MKKLALAAMLAACAPIVPEGRLACDADNPCPDGWFCHRDRLCYRTDQAPLVCAAERAIASATNIDTSEAAGVDVLLVIDDTQSMVEEQTKLGMELPRLMRALATGDLDEDGTPDGFSGLSVHFGVVTTDMGSAGFPTATCDGMFGDDGILRTTSDAAGCDAEYPSFLTFAPGDDADVFAHDADCVAHAGTAGCGYEQPLEAALKALTPEGSAIRFFADSHGHGDVENAGFRREDAALLIMVLTEEDDCSVLDPELFDFGSPSYNGSLNVRCALYDEALRPLSRYVEGFEALVSRRDRLVFAPIVGVPIDSVAGPLDFDAILARDEMQVQTELEPGPHVVPACTSDTVQATPARRIVGLASALEAYGARVAMASICQDDYRTILTGVLSALGGALSPECIDPGDFVVEDRLLPCDLIARPPAGSDCGVYGPGGSLLRTDGQGPICTIPQNPGPSGPGWFLDTTSARAHIACGIGGAGLVAFHDRVPAQAMHLECRDPLEPRVSAPCAVVDDCLSARVAMRCDPESFTCQPVCEDGEDCATGFECIDHVCSNTTCQ